jgi:hypothetical protein
MPGIRVCASPMHVSAYPVGIAAKFKIMPDAALATLAAGRQNAVRMRSGVTPGPHRSQLGELRRHADHAIILPRAPVPFSGTTNQRRHQHHEPALGNRAGRAKARPLLRHHPQGRNILHRNFFRRQQTTTKAMVRHCASLTVTVRHCAPFQAFDAQFRPGRGSPLSLAAARRKKYLFRP